LLPKTPKPLVLNNHNLTYENINFNLRYLNLYMADAWQIVRPKFTLFRLDDIVLLKRDTGIIMKM